MSEDIAADKVRVEFSIEVRGRVGGYVEMSRQDYDDWCDRLDNARGYEEERAADDLLMAAGIDLFRDLDIGEIRVDDFVECEPGTEDARIKD